MKNDRKNKSGLAVVEMALVLPLLLLLTFGAIYYGWFFLKAHQTTSATREGARAAVRWGATIADVNVAVESSMNHAGLGGSYNFQISNINPGTGEPVRASMTVPAVEMVLFTMPLLPLPGDYVATVTMAKEGP